MGPAERPLAHRDKPQEGEHRKVCFPKKLGQQKQQKKPKVCVKAAVSYQDSGRE